MYTINRHFRSKYEYLLTNYAIIVYNYHEMAVHGRTASKDVPARKKAYEKLKTAILSGDFSPKERLAEEHLAETLGVSRTPVREALYKLEAEGLIRPLKTRGFVVSGDSKEEMDLQWPEIYIEDESLLGYRFWLVPTHRILFGYEPPSTILKPDKRTVGSIRPNLGIN